MFRVSRQGQGIDDADTLDGARQVVRGQPPGRYDVDEIRAEPFASGHTSRSWGRMIRQPDGRVEIEPWPWPRPDRRSHISNRLPDRRRRGRAAHRTGDVLPCL
jgi:hypothetical protein